MYSQHSTQISDAEQEQEEINSNSTTNDTQFLIDWAARIELEFISFKSIISSSLKDVDFNEIPNSRNKKLIQMEKKIDRLNNAIDKLTQKINKLEKLNNERYEFDSNGFKEIITKITAKIETLSDDVPERKLFRSFQTEVDTLKRSQEELCKSINMQLSRNNDGNITKTLPIEKQHSELSDVKYFLKLLLPRIINIENCCHRMNTNDLNIINLLEKSPQSINSIENKTILLPDSQLNEQETQELESPQQPGIKRRRILNHMQNPPLNGRDHLPF
ncbi:hypothetical protein CAAN1_10S03444 [[Candida] anglica]|uniref:Uncharacterized protein n=1 Tax=[Candida] anglica TaxID=148631 RepID=A0ABP0EEK9_9ASCO